MASRMSRTVPFVALAALALGALSGTTVSAFRARTTHRVLFASAPIPAAPLPAAGQEVIRSRYVTIDLVALQATRSDDINAAIRPALLLNVFDDLAYNAEADRIDTVEDGFTWVGHVWGYDLSTVTLACVSGVVAGSIVTPDAVFAIRYVGDGAYEIAQIDQASLPAELAPMPVEPGASAAAGGQDSSTLQAGASLQGGAAGHVATPGQTPIVNTRVDAGASAGATSEHPISVESRATRIRADSQVAGPETERRAEAEVGQAASVERRALPLGSSPDGEPGRFVRQLPPGVLGGFNPEFAGGDRAVVRARVVAGALMRTVIDTPVRGAEVSSPFVLSGWSVDLASASGAGVDTVHAWAFPVDKDAPNIAQAHAGPDPGATAIWLGVATPGPPRPDVGRLYGPAFADASYRLDISNLAPGTYDVAVYPHRASTGQFEGARMVRVTVR